MSKPVLYDCKKKKKNSGIHLENTVCPSSFSVKMYTASFPIPSLLWWKTNAEKLPLLSSGKINAMQVSPRDRKEVVDAVTFHQWLVKAGVKLPGQSIHDCYIMQEPTYRLYKKALRHTDTELHDGGVLQVCSIS